jgi:hypothetical protein
MRKNLPVFPHRRVGFAAAAALFPADGIFRMSSPRDARRETRRGIDGLAKPGLLSTQKKGQLALPLDGLS